jgi:hypothetical protein
MKSHNFDDYIKVPKSFVINDKGIKVYDFKAMRSHFNNILKIMGE